MTHVIMLLVSEDYIVGYVTFYQSLFLLLLKFQVLFFFSANYEEINTSLGRKNELADAGPLLLESHWIAVSRQPSTVLATEHTHGKQQQRSFSSPYWYHVRAIETRVGTL